MLNELRSKPHVMALALTGILAVGHLAASWGYVGLWWGDHGRWLHEVDRFASGETLYRDFYWPFPPLALWIVGGIARVFGSSVAAVSATMAAVFLAICFSYYFYVRQLLPGPALALAIASGLLLAFAHASDVGAPLPLGMYTPAAPIGFLFLLVATVLLVTPRRTRLRAAMVGILAGGCILTKQDFWIPAAYVLAAYTLSSAQRERPAIAVVSAGTFAAVTLIGAFVVVATAGGAALPGILTGFGHVAELGARGFPSWERVTASVIAGTAVISLACLCIGVATRDRRARVMFIVSTLACVASGSLFLFMSGPSLGRMVRATNMQLLPLWLPLFALAAVLVRYKLMPADKRALLVMLLGLAIATHARRLFEGVEWYHFLLEIPIYVLTIELLAPLPHIRRAAIAFVAALTLLGSGLYYTSARGPLTRKGIWERVSTPRGVVRMPPAEADDFRWLLKTLNEVDPAGTRSLFSFGYTGGFDYFLGRRNPAPITQGFRLSLWPPDELVAHVRAAHGFLIDLRAFGRAQVPAPRLSLTTWKIPLVPSHYARYDRPYFNQLLAVCPREIAHRPANAKAPFFQVYDCR